MADSKRHTREAVQKYATGGTVVKSAEGPSISPSPRRADEGKRLAGRGLRRAQEMLKSS